MIKDFSANLLATILTLAKAAVKSRSVGRGEPQKDRSNGGDSIIIMGNGPSLKEMIDNRLDALMSMPRMAVNFAANADDFDILLPQHYLLADPHFFEAAQSDPNVVKLWKNLAKVDWDMTLHVPVRAKLPDAFSRNLPTNIKLERFNMTPGEGFDFFIHPLYERGLAMPRPRNVLVPAMMQAMAAGYRRIYLTGADHTWIHDLYVDDLNRVVSVQPHFYDDNKEELDRVAQTYAGLHLHDVLGSFVVALRSYHQIKNYADKIGCEIYNATPGSLIDAFPRHPL